MDALQRISTWITQQREEGRTDGDLHGTVFVLATNKTARITEANGRFDIEILTPPFAVDFTDAK
jgi:hypothetical protein